MRFQEFLFKFVNDKIHCVRFISEAIFTFNNSENPVFTISNIYHCLHHITTLL